MLLKFIKDRRITLIIAPIDGRCGYSKISTLCRDSLKLDLTKMEDVVVCVSKRRNIAKVLGQDTFASYTLTCHLHRGSYQRLMAEATSPAAKPITYEQLELYLHGSKIEVFRDDLATC